MKYHKIKRRARELRAKQTPSEQKLWAIIRNRKLKGRKFLRQHPIIYKSKNSNHDFFIPDFFCYEESLIIELDGPIHDFHKERDAIRDSILESKGLKVLRINNHELDNIDEVIKKIIDSYDGSPP